MIDQKEKELLGWAWVQMMVAQAMVGFYSDNLVALGLSKRKNNWIIHFCIHPDSPEQDKEDFAEIAGDVEIYLSESPQLIKSQFPDVNLPIDYGFSYAEHADIRHIEKLVDRILYSKPPVEEAP